MRGFIANILMATAILFTIPSWGQAQKEPVLDLSIPQNYRIGGITVLGAEYTDVQAVKLFSALQIGANITSQVMILEEREESLGSGFVCRHSNRSGEKRA